MKHLRRNISSKRNHIEDKVNAVLCDGPMYCVIALVVTLAMACGSLPAQTQIDASKQIKNWPIVNQTPGNCGDPSHVCMITSDGEGRLVNQSAVPISQPIKTAVDYGADPSGATDSTTAIRSYASHYPTGRLIFPTGTYKVTSTLTFNRQQLVDGGQASGTVFDCSAITTGACVVVGDNNLVGVSAFAKGGISNITLNGPGATSSSSIGLYLGADQANVISASTNFAFSSTFQQVLVTNFGTGVQWGNNTWNVSFFNSSFDYNGVGVYFPGGLPNSGESEVFSGCNVSNNTTGFKDDGGGIFVLVGTSVDYNSLGIAGGWALFTVVGSHLEQATGPIVSIAGNQGYYSYYDSYGSRYYLASSTGSESGAIVTTSAYTEISVSGGMAFAAHSVPRLINAIQYTTVSTPEAMPYLASGFGGYSNVNTITTNGPVTATWGASTLAVNALLSAPSIQTNGVTFPNLPTSPLNGTMVYCSDCKNAADDGVAFDSTAIAGGHGTNVLRENGVWRVH